MCDCTALNSPPLKKIEETTNDGLLDKKGPARLCFSLSLALESRVGEVHREDRRIAGVNFTVQFPSTS